MLQATLFASLVVLVIVIIPWNFKLERDAWYRRPTLRQYLEQFPHCRSARGIECVHCGSSSIRNWGRYNAASAQRTFLCNHCGTRLYRSAD